MELLVFNVTSCTSPAQIEYEDTSHIARRFKVISFILLLYTNVLHKRGCRGANSIMRYMAMIKGAVAY